MSRCFCLSTRTDEITSLHQNYRCHDSIELNNSSTVGNFKFYALLATTGPASLRSCSSSYQMSLLLLILEPGGLELLGSSYPLDLVEGIILFFFKFSWIMRSRKENFLNPSLRSVSNCYCWTFGCWPVVLSTRPRSSCWENNFGTSW